MFSCQHNLANIASCQRDTLLRSREELKVCLLPSWQRQLRVIVFLGIATKEQLEQVVE